jgi:hypothetical protein
VAGETEGRRAVGDDGEGGGESGVGQGGELWGREFGVGGDVCWVGGGRGRLAGLGILLDFMGWRIRL